MTFLSIANKIYNFILIKNDELTWPSIKCNVNIVCQYSNVGYNILRLRIKYQINRFIQLEVMDKGAQTAQSINKNSTKQCRIVRMIAFIDIVSLHFRHMQCKHPTTRCNFYLFGCLYLLFSALTTSLTLSSGGKKQTSNIDAFL